MALEQYTIGGQPHMLTFCEVTMTPDVGPNKGKAFVFRRKTGWDLKADAASVYLKGPDGSVIATGTGEIEPEWTLDTEFEEARAAQTHLAPNGGHLYVHFTMTFTHAVPGRPKITDTAKGCLVLQDPSTAKAADNTTIKLGGPCRAIWPNGKNPSDAVASIGVAT
jgi:hypothetical protein